MPVFGAWRAGRGARVPIRGLGGGFDDVAQARFAQVADAKFDGIGFRAGGELVHEAFVSEGVLQAGRGAQRTGKKWRRDVVGERAFGFYGAGAFGSATDVAGAIGGHAIGVVAVGARLGRGSSGRERIGGKTGERARGHVAGGAGAGAVAANGGPGFVIPDEDISLSVERGALVHDEGESVVFAPGHFVLAGELHAHGLAHRLRQQGGIEGGGIGAVQSVAAGTAAENDVHVFGFEPEKNGRGTFLVPNSLRRRIERGFIALHVGHGAGTAE